MARLNLSKLSLALICLPIIAIAQDTTELDATTQAFIRDEGLAVAVVENCKDPEFAMTAPHQARFAAMIDKLLADGFTKEQIKASLQAQGEIVRSGGAAEYLTENGVERGDLDSLCRFAQAQIDAGDTFGPFLSIR